MTIFENYDIIADIQGEFCGQSVYNKYHYLNDVCADHDYDGESTVPRAQVHNMRPLKKRFQIKAGFQSVFWSTIIWTVSSTQVVIL